VVQVRIVFHLGPLAPQPALGHVDTEGRDHSGQA
jgi:putative monooxygenase